MNINMTVALKSLTGEPLEELERYDNPKFVSTEETPDEKIQHIRKIPITLRNACINALRSVVDSDKGVSGVEKNKWFVLAMKLQKEDNPHLQNDEITTLKTRIGKVYGSEVVGRAYELLDPEEKKSEKKDKDKSDGK